MNINFSFDSSVSNAPSGFTNVFNQVASFFANTFRDPVTLNIGVGYGEIGGNSLASGAIGESSFSVGSYSYSQVKSALAADSTSSVDASAVASLPASNPAGGNYLISSGEAKALGLSHGSGLDGSVGFAAGNFDFDNSNGVSPGQLDFFGVVAHEVSEIMGRFLLVGQNGYSPMDLFHFSAPGARTFSAGGYFSADGGATNLGNFNTNGSGDKGDWSSSVGPDSFLAFAQSGVPLPVSANDIKVLDALGWDATSSNAPPPSPADTTPPTLSSTSPVDHATDVATGANLVLNFSEAVKAGAGNAVIHNFSDGSTVASIATNDASEVSFSGSTVTINPTNDLAPGTHYYVTINSGAIQDLAGNAFAGISASTDFDFTTTSPTTPVSGPFSPFTPFRPGGFNPFLPFTPSDPTSPSTPTTPVNGPSSPFTPFRPGSFNPFSPSTGPSITSDDKFVFSAGVQNVTSDSHAGHDHLNLPPMLEAIGDAGSDPTAQSVLATTVDDATGLMAAADPTHSGVMHPIPFYLWYAHL